MTEKCLNECPTLNGIHLFLCTFIQAQRCKAHNALPSPPFSSLNLCTQIQLSVHAQVNTYFLSEATADT